MAKRNFLGRIPEQFVESVPLTNQQRQLLYMACSLLLDYPHENAEQRWEAVARELPALPAEVGDELSAFLTEAAEMPLQKLQAHYVETFDQRRRCSMNLSYYSVGDTRQRGVALLAFKEQLAALGFEQEREELPDHLCVVLEAGALADDVGHRIVTEMLASHRDGLEVLRTALNDISPMYAHVVTALCMSLPEIDQETIDAYINLIRTGPPAELVGLGTPLPHVGMQETQRI
ncbi:nitrate reductase molybdenum cofactor assembly chaperone [Corynebacterium amycolatum]|uniref:nitrate reductase molybdenum cofactor assembly chaperone n=1 Tax=Corynebacterium amycolatum TaxID=43765 RepID=UPI003EE1F621